MRFAHSSYHQYTLCVLSFASMTPVRINTNNQTQIADVEVRVSGLKMTCPAILIGAAFVKKVRREPSRTRREVMPFRDVREELRVRRLPR